MEEAADSEEFSSSEEDEDYLPSGGEYSEDDGSELVKEDEVDGEEESVPKSRKRKPQSVPARKRKKGGLSLEGEEAEGKAEESSSAEDEPAAEQGKRSRSEDERKKKEDALWASFLSDVGPKARESPIQAATDSQAKSSSKSPVTQKEPEKPRGSEKVTITKVFDFAGEEVRVTKEVDAASKEAKSFLKLSEKEKPQADTPSAASTLPTGSGVCILCREERWIDLQANWEKTRLEMMRLPPESAPPGQAATYPRSAGSSLAVGAPCAPLRPQKEGEDAHAQCCWDT
ncbi:craniofacial development protein 1 isoform X2 [Tachyglossus aculeatus]|uniref:craniofacial development protein 1 isoform X2 n=1 Tax=Tachyglossus aculeatus TaxID=9261 RepID=UPI0018F569CC|nr:craniofacial development protein 1 isoform X2 [Tachyglossus aculeatus]